MKTIDIYCNYGVLGAEKRNVYTYGSPLLTAIRFLRQWTKTEDQRRRTSTPRKNWTQRRKTNV